MSLSSPKEKTCMKWRGGHVRHCFPWFDGHMWLSQHLPAEPADEHATFPSCSSVCRCFQTRTQAAGPAQVTWPPSQSPTVKTNQSPPDSREAVSWEGEAFIHIPGWHSALLCSANVSSLEIPKISSSSNYWLDFSWNQLFQYTELFFFFFNEKQCSLPSDCTAFGNFCLVKSELPLCTSEGALSFTYPALKKRFSFFWVGVLQNTLQELQRWDKTRVAVNL